MLKNKGLSILAFFDFSFIQFILPENPNHTDQKKIFQKNGDKENSSYYSSISKVKALLCRYLFNLPSDNAIVNFLESNDRVAKACGFSVLSIPDKSQINRFKNYGIKPEGLLAIFYFIIAVGIINSAIGEHLAAIDSSILDSYAKPKKKEKEKEINSADINAKWTQKHDKWYYGYKIHAVTDSLSSFIVGLFFSPANVNDNPILIPLLDLIKRTVAIKFKNYAADKGYDARDNYKYLRDTLSAEPVIDHRNCKAPNTKNHDIIEYKNNSWCCKKVNRALIFKGRDKKENSLKFECPNARWPFYCPFSKECAKTKSGIRYFTIMLKEDAEHLREQGTINLPKGTEQWKKVYNKRTAIERFFSITKTNLQLNGFKNISLSSIFTHVTLAALTHNLTILFKHFLLAT